MTAVLPQQPFSPENIYAAWREDEFQSLHQYFQSRKFEVGEKIFSEGETGQEMAFVLSGKLQVRVGDTNVGVIERGEIVGEIALFLQDSSRTADVAAIESANLVFLHQETIDKLIDDVPELATKLMFKIGQTMTRRLFHNDQILAKKLNNSVKK